MEKLQSSFKNMVIVLLTITGVAAAALGAVYEATKAPIAQAQALKQSEAIKAVVPEFDNDPIAEVLEYEVEGGIVKVFPAKKGGVEVGHAIETFTNSGYSGLIRIMVGVDIHGNIYGFSVLEHKETPGLGSKMQQWFTEKFEIVGMNPERDNLTVSKDGGDVDAITAATISSRAFLDAVNRGIHTLQTNAADSYTSATELQHPTDSTSVE
jgi:electron transport complex protein RnfG